MRLPSRAEARAFFAGFILGGAFMASPAMGVVLGLLAAIAITGLERK